MTMRFDIITIFPEFFESFKNEALIARAQAKNIVSITTHYLRDYAKVGDNHRTVDDRPYGGGAGMVLMAEPIAKAVNAVSHKLYATSKNIKSKSLQPKKYSLKQKVIVFSAKGKRFTQADARRYAKLDQLIMICGRYEGIDERVAQYVADEEVSIGEYVLFGGEVPAMVVVEAVTRLIPGALGKAESLKEESFGEVLGFRGQVLGKNKNLAPKTLSLKPSLEYPHYTRPEVIEIGGKKRAVPKVLLSGNHKKIEEWRTKKSKSRQIVK